MSSLRSEAATSTAGSRSSSSSGGRTRSRVSRLPYVAAVLLMGALVVVAWVARDSFTPVVAGEPAPEFTVQDLDGQPVTLDDYRGKVVLLNIWATWCPPCREEMPSMESLYETIGSEDFAILAVSVDAALGETDASGREGASKQELARFAQEHGLTFTILHNPSGDIQDTYQTTGVPESFVIGRDGVIYRRLAGATVWDHPRYLELIEGLLEG